MKLRSIEEIKNLNGKRVFVRADLDAPLVLQGGNLVVADGNRLNSNLETLRFLVGSGARIILAGYLDRPEGIVEKSKSTKPIATYYQKFFPRVRHSSYCAGFKVENEVSKLEDGSILVLENLRFLKAEEDNDPGLAGLYAKLADCYVNEAFANCHRTEASLVSLPQILPAYAGFNLLKEVSFLTSVLVNPKKPMIIIIGGAKIETKLPVVEKFLSVADKILVGGAVGCHKEVLEKFSPKVFYACGDPDLGFKIAKEWALEILAAKTIVWNGPMGDIDKNQILGTELIAQAVGEATQKGALSVVGGGDTVKFLRSGGFDKGISFISTGGGAMLEFLAGKKLPALKPLMIEQK